MADLFDPVSLGDVDLANRVVMAPMTRSRADANDMPSQLMVDYYAQRASAGLIITEGAHPSANGKGYCRTPGLFEPTQVAGWRAVNDAVHEAGGQIVVQLMHVGRIASHFNKAPGAETVAPSPIQASGRMFSDAAGMVPMDVPRALGTGEISGVVAEFAAAARLAHAAGFDGVELHCASGYLPMQFLSTGTNRRNDRYGGAVTNRIRFVVEVLEALADAMTPARVGLRIAPGNPFNGMADGDPAKTYAALLGAVDGLGLAYLHLVDVHPAGLDTRALARRHWHGPLILNESIDEAQARRLLADGACEAVAFGRPFIDNPDLVARFRQGLALASPDPRTLYSPGAAGYTDYPAYSEPAA